VTLRSQEKLKTRPTSAGSRSAPATVDSKGRCAGVGCAPLSGARLRDKQGRRYAPVHYEHDGRKQTMAQWAAETGMPVNRIYQRMSRGYTLSEALAMKRHAKRFRRNRHRIVTELVTAGMSSWGRV
jgi:hypothetical protein